MQKKVQGAIKRLVAAVHAEEPPDLEKDLAILYEAFESDEDSPFNSVDLDRTSRSRAIRTAAR